MATWSKVKLTDVVNYTRIDGDFFRPEYLKLRSVLENSKTLSYYVSEIIHPGEFKRIYSKDGVMVLRAQNIRPLKIDTESNSVFIPSEIGDKLIRNKVQYGDILITRTGANFGQTALFTDEISNAIVTSHTFILRPNNKINSAYLALYLNTEYGRKLIDQGMYGSSQPEIAPKFLKIIPVPRFDQEIEEQLSNDVIIAYKLRKDSQTLYQQATALLEQELGLDNSDLDTLSNKYVSTFNAVIAGKRLDPEYFNPRAGTIVERIRSLEHTTVAKQFHVRNGFPWNSKKFLEDNSGEPVIRIRDVKPTYIDNKKLTSIEKKYADSIGFPKAKAGDVVIGMDGLKYFYASLLEEDCMVNQRVCHIYPKENAKVSSEYVTFIINSKIGQAQIMRDMTIATTVGHITNMNVAKLVIPIVSDEFQKEITDLVRKSIDADKQSKQLLQEAKSRVEQLIEDAAVANQ